MARPRLHTLWLEIISPFEAFNFLYISFYLVFLDPAEAVCVIAVLVGTAILLAVFMMTSLNIKHMLHLIDLKITYGLEVQMGMQKDAGMQKVNYFFQLSHADQILFQLIIKTSKILLFF